jgi:hypothetical protein
MGVPGTVLWDTNSCRNAAPLGAPSLCHSVCVCVSVALTAARWADGQAAAAAPPTPEVNRPTATFRRAGELDAVLKVRPLSPSQHPPHPHCHPAASRALPPPPLLLQMLRFPTLHSMEELALAKAQLSQLQVELCAALPVEAADDVQA